MNVFASSPNPYECAKVLDDKRLVKMILETAQLIGTALQVEHEIAHPYKITHINHPCALWARKTGWNLWWLWMHGHGLQLEYQDRFGKVHRSYEIGIAPFRNKIKPMCVGTKRTRFASVTGEFAEEHEVHMAYRMLLSRKWQNSNPKWTKREPPKWRYVWNPIASSSVVIGGP